MNSSRILTEAYKSATFEPYGHLVIDLDPKTSDQLRFSSNLIGPEPSIFYITAGKSTITPLTNEAEARGYTAALVKA